MSKDDVFDEDGESDDADELDRHRRGLYQRISEYMEEDDINEAAAAFLLLDAAVSMRMTAYGIGVENPSAAGLKLDLDRLRREVDELVRTAKKGAEEYIRHVKEALAAAENEDEDGKE
jgi:hypothetical protein